MIGADVIRGGSKGRVGDWYVSAPAGADVEFTGVVVGAEGGGQLVFKDPASESYVRFGEGMVERSRSIARGADEQRIDRLFDQLVASAKRVHQP